MAESQQEDSRDTDADRQLIELSGELRLVLPFASILLAFLITLPFTARFATLASVDRGAYFLAFLSSALAIVLFLGAITYHQFQVAPYDKARFVATVSRQAIAGMMLLAVSLPSVVFLVTDLLYRDRAAILITGCLIVAIVVTWFYLPLHRRRR